MGAVRARGPLRPRSERLRGETGHPGRPRGARSRSAHSPSAEVEGSSWGCRPSDIRPNEMTMFRARGQFNRAQAISYARGGRHRCAGLRRGPSRVERQPGRVMARAAGRPSYPGLPEAIDEPRVLVRPPQPERVRRGGPARGRGARAGTRERQSRGCRCRGTSARAAAGARRPFVDSPTVDAGETHKHPGKAARGLDRQAGTIHVCGGGTIAPAEHMKKSSSARRATRSIPAPGRDGASSTKRQPALLALGGRRRSSDRRGSERCAARSRSSRRFGRDWAPDQST